MQPKRKRGICLATNPVLQNRLSLNGVTGGTFSSCRQSCDFTTFKGQQPQARTETSSNTQAPECQVDGTKSKDGSDSVFQVVPLDDLRQSGLNGRPVQPIGIKMAEVKKVDTGPREPFKYAGYVMTVMCSLICSIHTLFLKLLPVEDNLQEKAKACMIRGVFIMLFCAISIVQRGDTFLIARGEYWLNFFRATLGGLSTFLVYVSLKFITMGECSALVFSSPIWTCMLSFFILREPLPLSLLLAIPLSFLGIILLAHPDLILDTSDEVPVSVLGSLKNATTTVTLEKTHQISSDFLQINRTVADYYDDDDQLISNFNTTDALDDENPIELYFEHRWPGIVAALASSILLSVIIIILKFRKKTSIVTCSFYFGLAMAAISFCVQTIIGFGAWPTTFTECILHFGIGFLSWLGQCMLQWALQFVPAGNYSVLRSLDIVAGFIMGAIFLNEVILWTSIVGSFLIMIVVAILVLSSYFDKFLRKLCCFCCASRDERK
jgi:drug/metabolite transporter (DMT)-like permease